MREGDVLAGRDHQALRHQSLQRGQRLLGEMA